jgi:hypothetical protein
MLSRPGGVAGQIHWAPTMVLFHFVSLTLGLSSFNVPTSQRAVRLPIARAAVRLGADSSPRALLKLTQPTQERVGELQALSWNMIAIGSVTFEGKGVFGDSIGKVSPSSSDTTLTQRLPDGCLRYVFAGSGTVTASGKVYNLKPNTLVEVCSEASDAEVVWALGKGCDVLVVGASEYDSPARAAVRAAVPYLGGVLAAALLFVVASGALS